tara:strand:- start:170 stop:907 length:738 start_codon:yes stop_codon:yes gene_type:complete
MECENQRYEDNENAREVLGMTMRELKSVRAQLILAKEVALEATMVLAEVSPKKEVSLELEKLKEENEKLKTENEKLEGGIELCSDLLDQFDEGDILEYASDCYGFHDLVEGSTPYIELQEELEDAKEGAKEDLIEMKEELEKKLDEMKGANEDLVEQIGGVENDCEERITYLLEEKVELETELELGEALRTQLKTAHEERIGQHFNMQMNIALMKEIEKLKTELRESQVDNVVNELVSQVCDASE